MERKMIGRITETEIIWPEVDVDGNSYNRPPAMTYILDGGQEFVVLPAGFTDFDRLGFRPVSKTAKKAKVADDHAE